MIKSQEPSIPSPISAIEIDKAIYELQLRLDTNLSWLSHNYGRAYRHIDKNKKMLYFPEIYVGGKQKSYFRVTPDNDKSGMCFFVVGKEDDYDFTKFHKNYLSWNVGIVFSVNLDLINPTLLQNEIFTENLIRDVRDVLTMKLGGMSFGLEIKEVVREFSEIYREWSLSEDEEYLRAPMQGFRFNCTLNMQEECGVVTYDPCEALKKNLSKQEKMCVLSSIIFDDDYFNLLSVDQKEFLITKLGV